MFLLIGDYANVGFAHFNVMTRDGYAQDTWYRNLGRTFDTKVAFSLFIWYAYYYKAWFRTAPRGCPGEIPGCMFTERKFGRDI